MPQKTIRQKATKAAQGLGAGKASVGSGTVRAGRGFKQHALSPPGQVLVLLEITGGPERLSVLPKGAHPC